MHKWFSEVAREMNYKGVSIQLFLDELDGWELDMTEEFIKQVFRKKAEKKYGHTSTAQLDRKQVSAVYEEFNKFTAIKFGISIPFPSMEEQMLQDLDNHQ